MVQELSPHIEDKLRKQIEKVVDRASGQRTLSNWFGLRHNNATLFWWLPVGDNFVFRQIAGEDAPSNKLICEETIQRVVGEFVDINSPVLGDVENTGYNYFRRVAQWRSDQGVVFRRIEHADTFIHASSLRSYETQWQVQVAKS